MAYDVFEYNNQLEHYVLAALSPAELAEVRSLGFYTLYDAHEDANFQKLALLATTSLDSIAPPYNCYRTVEELYTYGAALASYYPNLADWTDVGNSWEKSVGQPDGYDMMLLRLTNESIPGPKPHLLLTASIHAREYAPAELAARFAGYLIENYNTNATCIGCWTITRLISCFWLTLMGARKLKLGNRGVRTPMKITAG